MEYAAERGLRQSSGDIGIYCNSVPKNAGYPQRSKQCLQVRDFRIGSQVQASGWEFIFTGNRQPGVRAFYGQMLNCQKALIQSGAGGNSQIQRWNGSINSKLLPKDIHDSFSRHVIDRNPSA